MLRKGTCKVCREETNVSTYRGKRCPKSGHQVYADPVTPLKRQPEIAPRPLRQAELFDCQGRPTKQPDHEGEE